MKDEKNKNIFRYVKEAINKKDKIAKKSITIVILIIVVILIRVVSIYMQSTTEISYKEQNNLDYRVYLKDNSYYNTHYLEKNMYYIVSLIEYIDINFNYNFKIDENINYDYKYYIEADFTVFEKSKPSNIMFRRKDILAEDIIENNVNSNEFNMNKQVVIDYDEYNNLAKEFKSSYNILADSSLQITLYIEIDGVYERLEYPVRLNNSIKVTIPLIEQSINISTDYKEINDNIENIVTPNTELISKILLYSNGVFLFLVFLSIIRLYIYIYKMRSKRSLYEKKMRKILKNYDRLVVKLKNTIPTINEERIIEVVSFEELLDVSDRLVRPILFIEVDKDKKSWFIVQNDEEIYRYTLEETDLKTGE